MALGEIPTTQPVGKFGGAIKSVADPVQNVFSTIQQSITGQASNTTIYQGGDGLNANGLPSNGDTSPYGQGFVGDPILTLSAGISAFTPINGQCPSGYQLLPHPQIVGAQVCTNVGGVRLRAVSDLLNQAQAAGYVSVHQFLNARVAAKRIWKSTLGLFSNLNLPGVPPKGQTGPTKQPPIKTPTEPSPGGSTSPTSPTSPPAIPVEPTDKLFQLMDKIFNTANIGEGASNRVDPQVLYQPAQGYDEGPAEPQQGGSMGLIFVVLIIASVGGYYLYTKYKAG